MKSEETRSSDLLLEYQNLLKVLAHTAKYLEGVHADVGILKSYQRLLRYLRSQPADKIPEILGAPGRDGKALREPRELQRSDLEISALTFAEILDLASNKETSRKQLERIATVRFGMTRGGLSALRNRDALVEKLRNLVSNENAHDSITRAAGQEPINRR